MSDARICAASCAASCAARARKECGPRGVTRSVCRVARSRGCENWLGRAQRRAVVRMRTVSAAVGDRPPGRRSLGRGTVGVAAAWACDNVTPSIECEGADEVEEVEARRRRHFIGALHAGGVTRGTRCQRGRGSRGSRFTHSPSPSQILARGGSALGSDGGTLETVRAVPWCFGVHVGASGAWGAGWCVCLCPGFLCWCAKKPASF